MHQILDYLRALPPSERDGFARRCGTTVGYLRKAVSIRQRIRPETCAAIERATAGAVTRQDLRPDDWRDIWPELAESEPKQPAALARQSLAATETVAQGVA